MRSLASPALTLALALAAGACDFFQELDSAESAGTTGGTSGGGATDTGTAGAGPCGPADDTCLDQDRLRTCDPATGEVTEYDCAAVCGGTLNFTCLMVTPQDHACWCVEPGAQKVYGCKDLEACLQGCGADPTDACANQCFGRTTAETIRTYGALVHCAQAACEPTCEADVTACAACLESAMAGTSGGCALARSVCDADTGDEPWP